jgi:hypothetical protein
MGTMCLVKGQRQTATLNYEISTIWETKPRTFPQKDSRLLMGPEQVTGLKPCKLYADGKVNVHPVADDYSADQ